jgi:hypothetical protein
MFIRKKMLTAPAESILGGVVPASPAGGDSILQQHFRSYVTCLKSLGMNAPI